VNDGASFSPSVSLARALPGRDAVERWNFFFFFAVVFAVKFGVKYYGKLFVMVIQLGFTPIMGP
jgi:hypothetical protein